ncbi:MAG: hypothetical protein GEU90_11285 [Gemmatimonas sp.]|nr:hypothetical protein [Gemmatimonas sp.]
MVHERLVTLFENSPLGAVVVVLLVGLAVAYLIGIAARRIHIRLAANSGELDGREGQIIAAVLGLLALLLGFTFSLAVDRFENRRLLVLDEANAISTAYLRAQLLDEPYRQGISQLLIDYAKNRVELGGPYGNSQELVASDSMLVELWRETVVAFPTIEPPSFAAQFVGSINEIVDLDAARKAGREAKVPTSVFVVLIFFLCVASAVLGYMSTGIWTRIVSGSLFLLLTLALLLVIDIDRPLKGSIKESQKPMVDLEQFLIANPPATFGSPGQVIAPTRP